MHEFTDFIEDVFRDFGTIQCRKMFGGYGVYYQGTMFALIIDEVLYLKADAMDTEYFTSRNLPPFQYSREGKIYKLSYYQAPEEIFDDPVAAATVAENAYAAALRSGAKKAAKKKSLRRKEPTKPG